MALRFLADHCVSNSTVQTIREANHEVLRLRDVLPVESSDMVVVSKAARLTSDPEFHPTTRRCERRNCPSVPGHPGTVEL